MKTNNLNTFSILYLIKGILTLLFSLFFIFYVSFGMIFTDIIEESNPDELPFNPGSIFVVFGIVGFIISVAFGILSLMASSYLKKEKNYNFIFAIAIVNCLTGILGILLGVFTLIELAKPEVKDLFHNKR